MPSFTRDEVYQAAALAAGQPYFLEGQIGKAILQRGVGEFFAKQASRAQEQSPTHFDIFLSHSYEDQAIVAGIHKLLTDTGFIVYVDWIHDADTLNRGSVTPETASHLRKRMNQCDSLFYVTAEHHIQSKWMPWECGYFDGYDSEAGSLAIYPGHVAILPVTDAPTSTYLGQEYLGIYPVAQKGNCSERNVNIHFPTIQNVAIHYDKWIKRGKP